MVIDWKGIRLFDFVFGVANFIFPAFNKGHLLLLGNIKLSQNMSFFNEIPPCISFLLIKEDQNACLFMGETSGDQRRTTNDR